jgi:hypothetical protein
VVVVVGNGHKSHVVIGSLQIISKARQPGKNSGLPIHKQQRRRRQGLLSKGGERSIVNKKVTSIQAE